MSRPIDFAKIDECHRGTVHTSLNGFSALFYGHTLRFHMSRYDFFGRHYDRRPVNALIFDKNIHRFSNQIIENEGAKRPSELSTLEQFTLRKI